MPTNTLLPEATFPIDFRLLNQQGQGVLYTRLQRQNLGLELINTSRGDLTAAKPESQDPGKDAPEARKRWCDDYHCFYIAFRPGTLWTPLADATVADWKLVRDRPRTDLDGYFLLPTKPVTIKAGKSMTLQLQDVEVDGRGGSHSTQVECNYQRLNSAGSDDPLVGNRLHYLAIMDELPSQDPGLAPVRIDWVGANNVLNDGKTLNSLTLRLRNENYDRETETGHPLTLSAHSKIFLHIPAHGTDPWALIEENGSDIHVEATNWRDSSPASNVVEHGTLTKELEYVGGPAGDFKHGDTIDITLTFRSSATNGVASVKVSYSCFGHLSDTVQLPVVKTPLVIPTTQTNAGAPGVAIGTASTACPLTIKASVASALKMLSPTDGGWGVEQQSSQTFLKTWVSPLQGNIGTASEHPLVLTTAAKQRLTIGATGNVGIGTGTLEPNAKLQISVDAEARFKVTEQSLERLKSKDVPNDVLQKLEGIKGQEVRGEEKFLTLLKDTIEEEQPVPYESLILKHADANGRGDALVIAKGVENFLSIRNNGNVAFGQGAEASETKLQIAIADDATIKPLTIAKGAKNFVTVLNDGNVGIGHETPSAKLQLSLDGNDKTTNPLKLTKGTKNLLTVKNNGSVFVGSGAGDSRARFEVMVDKDHNTNPMVVTTNGNPQLTVFNNGNVAIQDYADIGVPLTIGGDAGIFRVPTWPGHSRSIMPYSEHTTVGIEADQTKHTALQITGFSLRCTGKIAATSSVAYSDERIKHIEGRSDGVRDLSTLMNIEVTDYRYIDYLAKGNGPQKKVIAQQVEDVYPQAVTNVTNVVPDIYEHAVIEDGWVKLATTLEKGERVRLIANGKSRIHEVLEVTPDKFRTSFATSSDEVFVYGREVKDFGTVDYDALSMLNVSATQELARELEAKNTEIARLNQKVAVLEARDQAREARFTRLENAVWQRSTTSMAQGIGCIQE